MKFTFKNIGKIKEAPVELNGLTVIGGYNDIGKSTIGKTIFSVIKAVQNSDAEFWAEQREEVSEIISRLTVNLRKHSDLPQLGQRYVVGRLSMKLDQVLSSSTVGKDINAIFSTLKTQFLKENEGFFQNKPKARELFDISFQEISGILNQEVNQEAKYCSALNRTNQSIFRGEFNNKHNPTLPAEVICSEGNQELIHVVVNKEVASKFTFKAEGFLFGDATLIESPFILSLSHLIKTVLFSSPDTPIGRDISYPITDLIRKMYFARRSALEDINSLQSNLLDQLNKIVNGKLYYDEESEDFIFEKDSIKVKSVNLASGIKAFGVIQLLIISGAINSNTLLIIDEPEVHLHPEWQLKYAQLIAAIVNSGIYVLISSHSPYMIEALKVYSDKADLQNLTKFYVGKDTEEGAIFSDVTDNLEPLFHQLALPMQRLNFER